MTGGISIQSIDQRQSLILRRESLGIIAGSDSLSSFLPTSIVVEQNVEGDDVTTKSDTSSDSESNSEMAVGGQTRTDDVPPAIARPRTNLLMRMEPSRRRASVAVWADPQLAAMVQQRTAGTGNTRVHAHVPASSLSTPCATSKSENSLASDESSSNLITDERLLSIIFRYLQVTDLMRARQVHSTWNTVLRSASGLFEHVDISTRNKQVDDTVVTTIMGFCGDRVQSLILRNCWRVTNVVSMVKAQVFDTVNHACLLIVSYT